MISLLFLFVTTVLSQSVISFPKESLPINATLFSTADGLQSFQQQGFQCNIDNTTSGIYLCEARNYTNGFIKLPPFSVTSFWFEAPNPALDDPCSQNDEGKGDVLNCDAAYFSCSINSVGANQTDYSSSMVLSISNFDFSNLIFTSNWAVDDINGTPVSYQFSQFFLALTCVSS